MGGIYRQVSAHAYSLTVPIWYDSLAWNISQIILVLQEGKFSISYNVCTRPAQAK